MRSQPLAAASVLVAWLFATPAPNLNALGAILAGAPDKTWVEAHVSSDTLEGPFGAAFYVNTEWSDQSDRDQIKAELVHDGFVGGYGRTFTRAVPDSYITEDVKAFPNAARAMANYQWALSYWYDPNDTANNIATSSIPNSFGNRYTIGDYKALDIYFTKGNYVFTVTVGSKTDYLTDVGTSQAQKVYDLAPTRDVLKPNAQSGSITPSVAIVGGGAAAVVFIVVVVAVLLVVLTRRRRPVQGQYATLSPDGNYYWDGAAWQPVVRR